MPDLIANISSDAFNALNFVLFDLFFAAAIHYLTSEVSGLLNCYSAVKTAKATVLMRKIPLVGPGITCTKHSVFYTFSAIRFLSWILVFLTTFFSSGKSFPATRQVMANVSILGEFGPNQRETSLSRRATMRLGCMGRKDNYTYYGEIRNRTNCELNLGMIPEPIKFGIDYKPIKVSKRNCVREYVNRNIFRCKNDMEVHCVISMDNVGVEKCSTSGLSYGEQCIRTSQKPPTFGPKKNASFSCMVGGNPREFAKCHNYYTWKRTNERCENAVIGCWSYRKGRHFCRGTFNTPAGSFLCKYFNLTSLAKPTMCKWAQGIKWNNDEWLPYIRDSSVYSLEDAFAILYASGSERRLVTERTSADRQVTSINPLWFGILAVKIGIVLMLVSMVIIFRACKGFTAVANDEQGIQHLLRTAVVRGNGLGDQSDSQVDSTQLFVELDGSVPQLISAQEM